MKVSRVRLTSSVSRSTRMFNAGPTQSWSVRPHTGCVFSFGFLFGSTFRLILFGLFWVRVCGCAPARRSRGARTRACRPSSERSSAALKAGSAVKRPCVSVQCNQTSLVWCFPSLSIEITPHTIARKRTTKCRYECNRKVLSIANTESDDSVIPKVGPKTAAIWIVNSRSCSGIAGSFSNR